MQKRLCAVVLAGAMLPVRAMAGPVCEQPEDVVAIHTAALQQDLVVAAFQCHDVGAYNDFVLTHQAALQAADRALMAYFERQNPRTAFDAYNLYKTELANAASLHFSRDRRFCNRADANFRAAAGRPLDQVLTMVPYPVDTGSVRCPWPATVAATDMAVPQPPKRVRHRTWLGRLVDFLFH